MPGTILVSVLEFMDLPSSSSCSSISIKVSMGKRECQTWDKGDFTFPLTTLRDNLVLLLQDAEGNEILDAGVETKSIVEKGLWDAFFPLKGGGLVHMKLQFVLNEEERIRIRSMRESALKKKLGEFIYSNPSSVQITPGAGTNLASSLCLPNEISDRNEETSSGITLHQRVELPLTESCQGNLVEETEAQPLPANVPAKAKYASESSKLLRSSQSTVHTISLPNLQEDKPHNLEKQGPIQKTPSNVKKMISAFESGSAEDMRPCIKPPPKEVQSNSIKAGAPLKIHNLKEDNKVDTETAKSILEGVVKSFSSRDLLLDPTSGDKSGEQINLLGASDGTKSSHPTGIKNKVKLFHVHQQVGIKKKNFRKDFIATSTFETVQVSEKILSKHRHQPSNTSHGRRNSGGIPVIEESRLEISSTNISEIIDTQEASTSANVCTSVVNCEDRHIPFESSGAWIFPDEAIRFCITTSGKKLMDLLGGCREKPNIQQGRMNVSLPENSEENVKNHRPRKSKVDHPEEAETSGGKVGQAIKVAIMIGFGTLVLLTRQRKNSTEPEQSISTTPKWPESKEVVEAHGQNHRSKWDMTFAASSAFAVFIDPLICYAPVLIDDSACYYWDQKLIWTFFALRSAADLFYATDIFVFLSRSHAEPFATSWTKIIGGPHTKICKILNGKKTLRFLRILPRICAALPILQAIILTGKYTSVDKRKFFYLIPIQYTVRAIRLYRRLNRSSNIETSVRRLLKAILDFLPFILAAHLFGALWYFFAVDRKIVCWQEHVCKFDDICGWKTVDHFFYCSSFTPENNMKFNISLLHKSCAVQISANMTSLPFDFGIYLYALQSDMTSSKVLPVKMLQCFWWGLRNLSSFGSNLQTSFFKDEIIFSILISISGLALFLVYLNARVQGSQKMLDQLNLREKKQMIYSQIIKKMRIMRGVRLASLKKVPLLESTDEKVLQAICQHLKPVTYGEDVYIIREGEPLRKMFFITRGTALTYTTIKGGTNVCKCLEKSDFYGEELLNWSFKSCSFSELPISPTTVVSQTKVDAFSIRANHLKSVVAQFWWHFRRELRRSQLEHFAASSIQVFWRRRAKAKGAFSEGASSF